MEISIKKFGGTSLNCDEKLKRVSSIIKKDIDKKQIVVVSAMGRNEDCYSTDTLINLCKDITKDLSKRELDLIMSCGEIISACVLNHYLKLYDIKSIVLTGRQAGIFTNDNYNNAQIKKLENKRIKKELKDYDVIIVTGFQGYNEENDDITTLGRGGSDTTAILLAKSVDIKDVCIYTDVNGIMTADPKIEPNAKIIENIDYDEVFQMAEQGAKVIHPRAVEIAKNNNIKIVIKNITNEKSGTMILKEKKELDSYFNEKLVRAVANKSDLVQIILEGEEDIFMDVLNEIEENNISIDMINFFTFKKAFVINKDNLYDLQKIIKNKDISIKLKKDLEKVTIIGEKITGIPGVMAKVVRALKNENITIYQTSDSHMTISCLVDKINVLKAVKALHNEFKL
ncbi:aspartate kinase [Peptostreptococcaceae bacterium AGR-M142]